MSDGSHTPIYVTMKNLSNANAPWLSFIPGLQLTRYMRCVSFARQIRAGYVGLGS